MKKQRRLLSALLALTLVLGLAAPCASAEESAVPVQTETSTVPETPIEPETSPGAETPTEETGTPAGETEAPADPETSADSETPPTDQETPPTEPETPSTDQETPPTDQETPPTDQETPPTEPETPSTDQETPPTEPETPPTDQETPPTDQDAPPADQETPSTDQETPPTEPETPPTDQETPPADQEIPPTEPETPPTDQETPPTEPETPPADQETPPTDQDAPPADQETPAGPDSEAPVEEPEPDPEAAERDALLSQLSGLLSPEEYQTLTEGEPSLEALRAALSQAEETAAQKKAEEERLAAEAAERNDLLSVLRALLPPEEQAGLDAMSLDELRALKRSLDEEQAEKEELVQQLREILPEDEQAGLEELSLEELYALLEKAMSEQGLFPTTLAAAPVVHVTIQNPPPIQINPYGITIGGCTDSLISQPCLITSTTEAEVELTAEASAVATGGAKILNQSTRSDAAIAAHQTDEREIFLFLELQNVADETMSGVNWTTGDNNTPAFTEDEDRSYALIPRSGSGTATIMMPAAQGGSSYAAFKIGGDCSAASYMGEWKTGAWTDVDGTPVQGDDDGAEIRIVFTISPQLFYNVNFLIKPYTYNKTIVNPDQISVSLGGKGGTPVPLIDFTAEDGKPNLKSETPVSISAVNDFIFNVESSPPPTVNHTDYSAIYEVAVDIWPADGQPPDDSYQLQEDGSYHKQLYTGKGKPTKSVSEDFQFDANSIQPNSTVTITIQVAITYYSIST